MVRRAQGTKMDTSKDEYSILCKSKIQFQDEIQSRIEAGKILAQRNVRFEDDLKRLEKDFYSWDDYNSELLKQSFNKPQNEYYKSYMKAGRTVFYVALGECAPPSFNKKYKELIEDIDRKRENLEKLFHKIDLLKCNEVEEVGLDNKEYELDRTRVFIVHGHDDLAKIETARFIEKLGFTSIILHEQASAGQTIIEKIESYSNVGFGVVLYTPCDLGAKKGEENELKRRARQNVVFEHGYLIGKIGRQNVAALVKGDIETPNDISGVVYISMESNWELALAKELRNSGYAVDMNKVICNSLDFI